MNWQRTNVPGRRAFKAGDRVVTNDMALYPGQRGTVEEVLRPTESGATSRVRVRMEKGLRWDFPPELLDPEEALRPVQR